MILCIVQVCVKTKCAYYTHLLKTRYLSLLTSVDIDECARNVSHCDLERGYCTNTVGSYQCACNEGFTGNGTIGNCIG